MPQTTTRKPVWGYIRKLQSGAYQARYPHPQLGSKTLVTLGSYRSWNAANHALQEVHAKVVLHQWEPSTATKIRFGPFYREHYIPHARLTLAPRTVEGYESAAKRHLLPYFEGTLLHELDEDAVERWYYGHMANAPQTTRRAAYMVLRAVLRRAIKKKAIHNFPCTVENGSAKAAKDRPHMPFDLWHAVVKDMAPTAQVMMWLIFGAHVRVGEVIALHRSDYDPAQRRLTISRQISTPRGGAVETKTKTKNVHTVTLLRQAAEHLERYLASHPGQPDSYVFRRADDRPYSAAYLRRQFNKARALHQAEKFHLCDGKHVGLTMVASSGAPIKLIQSRAGHSTTAAALVYQHSSEQADAELAASMSERLELRLRGA